VATAPSSPETLQMDDKMLKEYAKEVRGDVNVNGLVVNGNCPVGKIPQVFPLLIL
jgi:hypothetical protein